MPVRFLNCAPIARNCAPIAGYQVVQNGQNTDKMYKINSFELGPNVHPPQEALINKWKV